MLTLYVPDELISTHENTFWKRNHKKLGEIEKEPEGEARTGVKSLSLWTISWHLKG